MRQFLLAVAAVAAAACGAPASPFTLTNAPGPGSVTVGVDGFGAFGLAGNGNAADALFTSPAGGGPTATTFQSGVAFRIGNSGGRTYLTSGNFNAGGPVGSNPTVTGTATSGSSSFSFGGLNFALTQTLTPTFVGGVQAGSTLAQSYVITNPTNAAVTFELVRYLDGDLRFDGSLVDGGGRLGSGGSQILFETDSATGAADPTTFIGITGTNSSAFEIASFSGLRSRIELGTALANTITNDGNNDGFIDAGNGYDVTLGLGSTFTLGSGQSLTYTTTTIFGNGAPAAVTATPEPLSVAVFGGLVGVGGLVARRRMKATA